MKDSNTQYGATFLMAVAKAISTRGHVLSTMTNAMFQELLVESNDEEVLRVNDSFSIVSQMR